MIVRSCFILVVSLFTSAALFASSSYVNPGSSMTTGPTSNHHSLFGAMNNPAMGSLVIADGEKWRVNYFPSISVNAELGDVDNFADDLDDLIDIIDDASSTTESADEILDRFNDVLVRMGEDGYLKNSVSTQVPIMPLYRRSESLGGTLFVNLSATAQAALFVLDDTLFFDAPTQDFITNTAVYLKSGIETRASVGFSRPVFGKRSWLAEQGDFYAGITLSYVNIELSKQVAGLEELDGEAVEDFIRDEYDNNLKSSGDIELDIGIVWDNEWWRVGLVAENINSPEFDYGTIGVDCESRPENTRERNSCQVANFFINQGRLSARETHKKHAYVRADGLIKFTDRWKISAAVDLAEYDDVVGFENQWLHLSTSIDPKRSWLPAARVGWQRNLAGTELDSIVFGFTFFRFLGLDFEWGQESVDVDGDNVPRRLGISLSFAEHF